MKRRFLVVYDYGQGGVWVSLLANSPDEIQTRYPEFQILEAPPDWMTEEHLARIKERMTIDIDDNDDDFLRSLRDGRTREENSP